MRTQESSRVQGCGWLLAALCAMLTTPVAAQPWPHDAVVDPPRGRIGVQVQPMTPELREHFQAPADRGRGRNASADRSDRANVPLRYSAAPQMVVPFRLTPPVTTLPLRTRRSRTDEPLRLPRCAFFSAALLLAAI